MNTHETDFRQLADDADIPTTESALKTEFDALKRESGLPVSNTSAFSPFWRFVDAVAIKPVLWLLDFLVLHVLPQAFVKTATGVMLELHAWAVNIERKQSVKAKGQIRFARVDASGEFVLPAGTVVSSPRINGVVYRVLTVNDATFAVNQEQLDIDVQAQETGEGYNLAEGLYSECDVQEIASVENFADWLTVPGADRETDEDLRSRIRNQYSAINQWHTDAVYTSIIAAFDGVSTDNIYFERNAPRGPGTANAFVMLETGNPSDAFIADIQRTITDEGNHGHGDDLRVMAMPEAFYNVTCACWLDPSLGESQRTETLAGIETFIRGAFRQNTQAGVTRVRPWSLFSFSKLGQEIHAQFPAVLNLDFVQSHIESGMQIPRLEVLTLSVAN